MHNPTSVNTSDIAQFTVATSLSSSDANSTRAFKIFSKHSTFTATVSRLRTMAEAFDNNIANATKITFSNGIVSTGEGGSINNEVSGSRYFGMVDANAGSSSAFNRIRWHFPTPILGFGAEWIGTADGSGLTIAGNFDGQGIKTVSFNDVLGFPGNGFLGIVGTVPFSEITFQAEGIRFGTEGFRVGNLLIASAPLIPLDRGLSDRPTNILKFSRRQPVGTPNN